MAAGRTRTLLVLAWVSAALLVVSTAEESGSCSFKVTGKVYCDTCQCGFETTSSTYISGAKVKLECLDRMNLESKYEMEGVTNEDGEYIIPVWGDHGDDICDVSLVSSSMDGCTVADPGRDKTRVTLTGYNGLVDRIRHANAMGFRINEALPNCEEVLQQYKLNEDDE